MARLRPSSFTRLGGPASAWKAAGMTSAMAASVSRVAWARAPVTLKRWCLCLSPPASTAAPSTSRMLPMMLPVSEALTTE